VKPLGAFFLSWVARLAYLAWRPPAFDGYYWKLSTSLRNTGTLALDGVRTARFEPLYPLFLAGARAVTHDSVFGVQVLQCGVASLGALFLFLAARRLGNERVALIASVLYALHPLLIRHAAELSDSALTTSTMLLFVLAFVYAGAAGLKTSAFAGACLGLTVLTRSVAAPLMVLSPLLLFASRRWMQGIAFAAAALVVITPMLSRDYALTGALVPARSGVNLFIGNSDYTPALLPEQSPDILQRYADQTAAAALPGLEPDSPGFDDKADPVLGTLAWNHIKAHPHEALRLRLRNVWYFLGPFVVPSRLLLMGTTIELGPAGAVRVGNAPLRPLAERAVFTAFSSTIGMLALVGVYVRGRSIARDGVLWCVLATFVAVYSVYFPATRYAAPVAFVSIFYAAVAAERGFTRMGTP
jgi:hypothetical protein